MIYNMK